MLRRSFRFGLLVGILGGAIAAVVKAIQGRAAGTPEPVPAPTWSPLPDTEPAVAPPRSRVEVADLQEAPVEPAPPVTADRAPATAPAAETPAPAKRAKKAGPSRQKLPPWVEPVDGDCPKTHPVKAKMSSGIYHVVGGLNYERTKPDRCYVDAAAAEADGLRPSKI